MNNKYLAIIILLAIAVGGYYWYGKNNTSPQNEVANNQIVGGDKDEHGCIGSAGYIYSAIKNSCVRLFESGIRLDPKDETLDKTQSAFVLFKSQTEYQTGELYLPGQKVPTILAFKEGKWSDQDGKFVLFESGKEMFLVGEGNILLYATAEPTMNPAQK
jgi:hypothetical protein